MYTNEPMAKEAGTYEELSIFLQRMRERMEGETAEADQAEAHAKMARHRAEQTRALYNVLAKHHESMANVTAEPAIGGGMYTATQTPYRVT